MKNINVKELEAKALKLRKEANEISEIIRRNVAVPKAKGMVGKCFRYLNSYGGDHERWWLYIKVKSQKDGYLTSEQFQTDCFGKFELDPKQAHYTHSFDNNYEEIAPKEYAKRLAAAFKKLSTPTPEARG